MRKTIRFQVALAAVVLLAGAAGFAQSSGEAIYKAKCQSCHGPTGLADTAVGKALKVKPVTDPAVRKFTEAEMVAATSKKNRRGPQMQWSRADLCETVSIPVPVAIPNGQKLKSLGRTTEAIDAPGAPPRTLSVRKQL